jgi:hypothetical protein
MAKKSNSLRPGTTFRRAAARAIADALRPRVSPAELAAREVYLMALRRTASKSESQQQAALDAAETFLTAHGASAEDCAAGLASARDAFGRKNSTPKRSATTVPGGILARFNSRPADTSPLRQAGLKWDRERGAWTGPDTETSRAAVTSLGGTVEGAA